MENTAAYTATFSAGLLHKIVDQYKDTSDHITMELNKRITHLDISNPLVQISLDMFNEIVEWIEHELGSANLKMIGIIMGETAYNDLRARNKISEKLTPKEAIEKLPLVSQSLIIDPLKRNWKILEVTENFARIKKSQIFHPTIQIGIIESFIRKVGVVFPRTRLVRDYKKGPAFDEFEITWY